MGHLLSTVLISISVNLDCFAISLAYGVKKIKIGIYSNLAIAGVTTLGTFSSMTVGKMISKFLSASIANLLGSGVLLGIGIWSLWQTLTAEQQEKRKTEAQFENKISYSTLIENPEKADLDNSKFIDIRESLTIAFAVTIDNLVGGVGAGISGLNVPLTTFLTFAFSMLALICGYFLGKKFTAKLSGRTAGVLSASLIICIAIYEFFNR